MCLEGASRAGADLTAALPDANLRACYVWVPMLPGDNAAAARAAANRFDAPRTTHYWDSDRRLSRRLAKALGIDTRRSAVAGDEPAFAWDIYLAYRDSNDAITAPDFWMHQLAVDHAPRLDALEWQRRIDGLLAETGAL
jgi:hypothetical protein